MPNNDTSTTPKQSTRPALFRDLTKPQLVELLLEQAVTQPLTRAVFYRCAVAIVTRFCDDALAGRDANAAAVMVNLNKLVELYRL